MSSFSKHLLLLLALAVSARGDISLPLPPAHKKTQRLHAPAPPPEAAPVDARVRRGGSVEIPLQVFGVPGQPLTYRLRTLPRAGKLSEVRMISPGTGVVIYRHSGEGLRQHDKFSFAAQIGGEVSESVEVNITIVDDPPALGAREEVDFGTVRTGSTATREVTIENRGGGVLKGIASIGEPWQIDGKASYSLRSGEKHILRLRIAPQTERVERGEIRYSSDPGQKTILSAVAEAAVAITPERLDLQPGRGASRAGVLTIANRTGEEIPLRLRIGGKLKGPERAILPAGGAVSIKIEADAGEAGPIDGAVQVECPSFMADIDVHAAALGAVLRVSRNALSFGKVDGTRQPPQILRITDAGGTGTFVKVQPSSRLVVAAADCSFWLEAGSSRDIAVSVDPLDAGRYRERLTILSDANGFEIPAAAEVTRARRAVVTVAPAKSRPTLFESLNLIGTTAKIAEAPHFGAVQINRVTATTCEIAWRIPANTRLKYQVESLSPLPGAAANGNAYWIPLTNAVLHDSRTQRATTGEALMSHGVRIDGMDAARPPADLPMSASIDQLSPGTLYTIRVLGKDGDASEASHSFVVRTARASLLTSGPLGISGAACVAMLALGVWYKKREAASEDGEDSPAPLPAAPAKARRRSTPGPSIRELGPGSFEIAYDDPETAKKIESADRSIA